MGQYHKTVNLDKHEFLDPHMLGDGLKLVEQAGWSPGGVNDALHLLLAVSSGRGGGDFEDSPWVGRWGGDRIAVVGDYAEDGDLAEEHRAGSIYTRCYEPDLDDEQPEEGPRFRNITEELIPVLEVNYEIVYFGNGWRGRRRLNDLIVRWEFSHSRGKRVAQIGGRDYALDEILAALKADPERIPKEGKLSIGELDVRPYDGED